MKIKKKNSGFSFVELLLAGALLTTIVFSFFSYLNQLLNTQNVVQTNSALSFLSQYLESIVLDQNSWQRTKLENSNIQCALTFPPTCCRPPNNCDKNGWSQTISLYDKNGTKLTDATNADFGFRADGTPCSFFKSGYLGCTYRAEIIYTVRCSSVNCSYPEESFQIRFFYSGRLKNQIMPSRYNINSSRVNFATNDSPTANCAQYKRVFIGIDQSVVDGNGNVTVADENGCVDISAFAGMDGSQGGTGSGGVMGPQGPKGPDGIVITPTSPLPINGACGASNGGTYVSAPTVDLCSSGTPSKVTGALTFSWICYGANGGTNVTCKALQQINCSIVYGNSYIFKWGMNTLHSGKEICSNAIANSRCTKAVDIYPPDGTYASCLTPNRRWEDDAFTCCVP